MKKDENYWKKAYELFWNKADKKERDVKDIIEKLLDTTIEFYGLGAGETVFIEGSAEKNSAIKGDADLYIKKYDAFLEVTGPMIKVDEKTTLWIRPDKVRNAINKIDKNIGKNHFVIHVAELKNGEKLFRAIKIGKHIEDAYREKSIKLVHPTIRGKKEKYLEIPYNHSCVYSIEQFKTIITAQ